MKISEAFDLYRHDYMEFRIESIRILETHEYVNSFATNFLQNNGNIRYCQTLLGHASLETTMKYTHVTDCDLEKQYKKFHSI